MVDEKQTPQNNWLLRWWHNVRNVKKNVNVVRASPYASLNLAYKARIIIVSLLVPYLIYMTYKLVRDYPATGGMLIVGRVISIAIMGYVCWKIYETIPMAKSQIAYYKKYPHLINYCPADVKETVDSIFTKIKENNKPKEAVDTNVGNKQEGKKGKQASTSSTTSSSTGN